MYGYAIYRDGGTTPLATTAGPVTTYQDTSVAAGSTHTYTVAAFDYAKNYSAPSTSASATTPASTSTQAAVWNMDEPVGTTTMVDSSGNGNNGTLVGGVEAGVPGEAGTAYSFNGTSSYVDVPNAASLVAGPANINISFWLNTTHLPSSGDYDLVRMGVYPGQEYKVELEKTNQIGCTFHGLSGSNNATGGANLANGAWHHIVCIKTSSQIQLWIDGVDVKNTAAVIGSVSPTSDVTIGSHGTFDWYQGTLDDVSIAFG